MISGKNTQAEEKCYTFNRNTVIAHWHFEKRAKSRGVNVKLPKGGKLCKIERSRKQPSSAQPKFSILPISIQSVRLEKPFFPKNMSMPNHKPTSISLYCCKSIGANNASLLLKVGVIAGTQFPFPTAAAFPSKKGGGCLEKFREPVKYASRHGFSTVEKLTTDGIGSNCVQFRSLLDLKLAVPH